jgi:hypothetical protein
MGCSLETRTRMFPTSLSLSEDYADHLLLSRIFHWANPCPFFFTFLIRPAQDGS